MGKGFSRRKNNHHTHQGQVLSLSLACATDVNGCQKLPQKEFLNQDYAVHRSAVIAAAVARRRWFTDSYASHGEVGDRKVRLLPKSRQVASDPNAPGLIATAPLLAR
jgi:hypothetical protein